MAFIDPYKNREYTLQEYARAMERGQEAKEETSEEKNVLLGAVDTAVDLGGNVLEGAGRSIEGIFDMVAGVVGGVGGLISKDFQEGVQDVIEFDVTDWAGNEIFNRAHRMLTGRDIAEDSYLKDGGMIEQVLQGVGGMLPAVAVSVATGGAGAPAAMSQALSTITMAVGAAGQATQEAYKDGAGYYQGLAYGAIRGGTEVVTEKLFTGLDAGLFGKGLLPPVAKSVADTGVKRFVKGALQEGAEEMASELLDPLARSVYQGKEAYKKYLDPAFYGDVWDAGVAGTLTGATFSGTVGRALSGGAVAEDVQSVMTEVDTLERKRRNLFANDKLTDEANTRIGEDIRENYRVLEGVLKKAPDNKRAAVIEKYELSRWFDEDGALKPEFSARLDARAAARQTATDAENGDPAGSVGLTGRFDSRYHDPDAEEASIDAALSMKGRAAFSGELSKEGKARYRSLKKVMNTFSRVSGDRLHFVIAEESPDTNAYYDPNTDVIVIGADVLERGDIPARGITRAWFETALHEVTHTTEGTEAHKALSERLEKLAFMPQVYEQLAIRNYFNGVSDEISTRLNALLSKETLTEAEQTEVGELSRKVREAIEARIQTLTAKGMLTAEEEAELSRFASESTAIMAERVLNSESFVRRLIREDAGLVEKLLLKIADIKEAMTRVGDKLEREVAREIKAAEDQLLRAVSEEGLRFEGGKFVGSEEDEEEKGVQYSIKRPIFTEENIQRNMEVVAEMDPVAEISAKKLERTGKRPKELFAEYFDSLGNNIYSPIYGDIALSNSSVKSEIRHGITAEKIASIEAIPSIIENGKVIFHRSKSDSDVERLVICAPITIASQEYYMGVMLQRDTQNQRLYLHSVLSLETKEEATASSQADRVTNGALEDDNHLFMTSILQKAVDVKRNLKKSSVKESRKPKSQTSVELTEGADVNELLEKARAENAKLRGEAKDLRVKLDELSEVSFRQFQDKIKDGQAQDLFYKLQAQEAARRIYKESKATAGLDELTADMETLLFRMLKKEMSYEEIKAEVARITDDFVGKQKAGRKVGKNAHAVEVLETLRSAKIRLTETQVKEVVGERGSYDRFRKSVFGRLKFTKVNGVYLDSLWQEWSELYPELFKTDIAEGDMPAELARIYDEVRKNRDVVEYFWDDEVKEELKFKIFENLTTVQHSEESMKGDTMRAVLGRVMEETVTNQSEFNLVRRYRKAAAELDEKQETINDLWRQVSEVRTYFRDINSMQTKNTDPETRGKINEYLDSCKAEEARLLTEIDKVNAELDKADSALLQLSGAEPLRRIVRSEIRKAKAKLKETEKSMKEDVKKQEATRRNNREMVTRERVARRVIGRLNTLFFNPTKTKHVPPELQALVEKVLTSEDLGSFKEFRKNMREIAEVERAIERLEQNPAKTAADQDRLDKLHYKYKQLEGETLAPREQAEALLTAYKLYAEKLPTTDKVLLERLEADLKAMEKTPLSEMGLESIKAVEEFYKLIYHQIQNSTKLFSEEREQRVSDMGNEVMKELMEAKAPVVFGTKAGELTAMGKARSFLWKNVKPLTAFEIIGSSKLKGLFLNVMKGEEVWARDIQDARAFILEAKKKYGFDEWDLETRKEFTDAEGKTVKLNLSELMSLYAYSFRDQAVGHLTAGGFVLSSHATDKTGRMKLERSLNDATRYVIGQEEIMDIASLLTKEQQEFVQTLQGYLSDVMGKKGNEVSMMLYGMELFREKFYFPIKSKKEYLEAHTGRTGDPNIKNRGMAKEVVPDAKNPLVLEDFMDICVDHINSMATYHAFVLPVEDLMRVYNYAPSGVKQNENGEWVKDEENDGDFSTIQAAIVKKYGKVATGYIEQVIRDLNGGARRDAAASLLDRGLTAFKRAATMMSLSTIIQQPTSVARAMAYVNVKYFAGDKVLKGKHREKWRAVMEAAPVAVIKDMGGYDTGVGSRTQDYLKSKEYETLGEKFGGFFKDGDYRAEVFGRGAAFADEVAWISIYEACVREQADKLKVPVDSKPAMMMGAKRFAEVIRRTQVYDSTLTRTEIMRSKDTGAKMVTAFMAEPSTVVNMMIDGIVRASRGDWAFMGKTVGAVTAAIILNSILVSLVYAMRDDDEDQNYGEKYLESLLWEMSEGVNPAEYFPYLRDIMSLVKGYDVERSDMTLFAQLIQNVQSITSERKTPYEKVVGVAGAVSSFFGLPVKNVERDARGMLNTVVGSIRKDPEEDIPDAVRQEMNRLVINGMDVLPRGVGDVITYEGQSVKLTAKQKAQFRKVYGEANEAVSRMVSMKLYTGADDEAKAKAIKRLYGIYYNRAIEDLLGVDIENKNVLMSRAVDPAQLSIIAAVCAGLGADVGKDGKAISGSKKAKVISYLSALNLKAAQKHLILGYLGYKNAQGEEKVRAYLAGLGLGREEVKELLSIGGY